MTNLDKWVAARDGDGIRPQLPSSISFPITLYVRYTDPITGLIKPIRCVLENCFYHDKAEEIRETSGVVITRAATVHIPHPKENTGRQYLDPEAWAKLSADEAESGKYWSYDPTLAGNLPWFVPDIIYHEFPWGTVSQIVTLENRFLTDVDKRGMRSIGMDNFVYGSYSMQHHLLRA